MALGEELAELTKLSDLASGAMFTGSEGYWTGIPVPRIGRYALMRTWPAPEMPRPGCVWTHALLLEPSVLENVHDLSVLSSFFTRPTGRSDQERYGEQLFIQTGYGHMQPYWDASANRVLRELISALYDTGRPTVSVLTPLEADAPLFALWSQQWPRLRRNFRFQTAVSRDSRSSGTRMDVSLKLDFDGVLSRPPDADWVDEVVNDILLGSTGSLRSFLWHYGHDVRRQRGSFRPLVAIELMHRDEKAESGSKLLKLVAEAFPDPNDALSLKQDIIDGRVVPRAQLDVLWLALEQGGAESFPRPSQQGISRLATMWGDRSQQLLHLAEKTARAKDELGKSVFEIITESITSDEFWSLTESYPRVREQMVRARPKLLTSDLALRLDNGQLEALLKVVPKDHASVQQLIPNMLARDNLGLVEVLIERFPETVAHEVVSALDKVSTVVGPAWLQGLVRNPHVLLNASVMARIRRMSLLFEIADRLGWLSSHVIEGGTEPWSAALENAIEDLPDDKLETFEVFLVGLALGIGGEGGRVFLERYLARVHEQILRSRLPWQALSILTPCLPDIGWIRAWDYGLRLRMAVAAAYVRWGYPVESYANLLHGKRMKLLLAEAASQVAGGESLARAANDYRTS